MLHTHKHYKFEFFMLLPQVLEEGRKPTSLFTYKVNFEHIENFFLKRVRVGE